MTTNTAPATTARPSRALNITLWTVQSVLAAFYAFAATPKLLGDPTTADMMAQIGFANWVGYFIGAAELAGAIGLLIPRLTSLAATGLALLMVGATVTNTFTMGAGAAAMTLVLAAVFATVAYARRSWITRPGKR
ncbi:DoxX family protein [Stackebrandtia nassauensis]|uniref:DoxX family protein n=1 Tax=Stackebrandtia nassauensis (strain DSM 44728 / CIP 108903 / NRRL B-16338 / NBRC 102104 / LLR-40K-21) TaxID=446470 RepID=D3PXC7_STANL|nr:DoxX family protein [Stackebrandtia nassauensis]ADD41390.1 DoxX family protein [Stackebrandtia nassauensis DSM 44728]